MIKDLALEQVVGHHHALGTSITLQIFGTQKRDLLQKSFELIDHYEDLLTVNRDESEVMDINHAAGEHPVQGQDLRHRGEHCAIYDEEEVHSTEKEHKYLLFV